MKVLAVSTWCPTPSVNGSKVRVFHLLQELARCHQVRLITFAGDGDEPASGELASCCEHVEAVRASPFLKAPASRRGLLSSWPRSLVQTYSAEMEARVAAHADECEVAVAFQTPAALYLQRLHAPVVMDEVELGGLRDALSGARTLGQRLRGRLTWWKSARFVSRLARSAAMVTVTSQPERALLVRVGVDPARVSIVPNGIGASDVASQARPADGTLIYPGAITYAANRDAVEWFVRDILPRVRSDRPDATVTVTGDVDHGAAARLSASHVRFTGRLPHVRDEIAGSRVCVVPLRRGGGTRLKILQAMALGTPVVSTTKGAEGLEVRDGIDILLADDAGSFAAATLRLLNDDALRDRLVEQARELVRRKYTWRASGETLHEALTRAAARPGATA